MKNIMILGATGSIGTQTLDVIREHSTEFKLVGFTSGKNIKLTEEIIKEFSPEYIAVRDEEDAIYLSEKYDMSVYYGAEGLLKAATYKNADTLVNAVVGRVGLEPTIEAIKLGKRICLANKETLVTAGDIVMKLAKEHNVTIFPIDSEHNAIFQCLNGEEHKNIDKLIITASGGSFRDKTREELANVTKTDALNHPNWSMGAKITIDSATMMNKGLEVIEAYHLFNVDIEDIEVLIHRESMIHSMVQYNDGSIIAELGLPDMKIPIQYALTYPERLPLGKEKLNLAEIGKLHFEKASFDRYPCLRYAFDAIKIGGTLPAVMNAANEVAVDLFLRDKITFLEIESIIKKAMDNHTVILSPTLEEIQRVDEEVRNYIYKDVM